VVTVLASFVPHALRGGWGEEQEQQLLRQIQGTLATVLPDIEGRIAAHELLTPVDLEERYGLTGGQLHHGEPALDQLLHMRPDPELSRNASPITGLWLAGAGCHPGPGLCGASGRLAARAMIGKR